VENSRSVLSLVSWSMVYLGRGATPGWTVMRCKARCTTEEEKCGTTL
jgi:hypothetical protein